MRLNDKLDKIIDKQSDISMTLAKMEVDLAHHIKRSDSHEERMEKQDKKIDKIWWIVIAMALGGAGGFAPEIIKKLIGG
jgi:hypothetical protein